MPEAYIPRGAYTCLRRIYLEVHIPEAYIPEYIPEVYYIPESCNVLTEVEVWSRGQIMIDIMLSVHECA